MTQSLVSIIQDTRLFQLMYSDLLIIKPTPKKLNNLSIELTSLLVYNVSEYKIL